MYIDIQNRWALSAILLACWSGIALGSDTEATATSCTPPIEIQSVLKAKLPGWKIVRLSDLWKDDQAFWTKRRDRACPGLASGNYRGLGREFAATLIRGSGPHLQQTLVLIGKTQSLYHLKTLIPPQATSQVSVVYTVPPDTFEDLGTGESVEAKTDSLAFEAMEASAIVYIWNQHKFKKIWVMD